MKRTLLLNSATEGGNGSAVATDKVIESDAGTLDLSGGDDTSEDDDPLSREVKDADELDQLENAEAPDAKLDPNKKFKIKPNVGKTKVKGPQGDDLDKPIGSLKDLKDDEHLSQKEIDEKNKKEADAEVSKADKVIVETPEQKAEKAKQASTRDYSIFDKTDEDTLKKQPNHVFDLVKKYAAKVKTVVENETKLKKDLEDASKGIVRMPESYIEHPDAWIFHPETKQIQANIKQASFARQHYVEQLSLIEDGEPWVDITGYDDKGNAIFSQPIPANETTSADKVNIQTLITKADTAKDTFQGKLGQLRTSHKQQHDGFVNGVKETCKKAFPWYGNDAVLDDDKNSIGLIGEDGKTENMMTLRKVVDLQKSIIPKEHHNNPFVDPLVNMMVANAILNYKLRLMDTKKVVSQQLEKDVKAAEPNVKGKTNSGPKASDKMVPSVKDLYDDD